MLFVNTVDMIGSVFTGLSAPAQKLIIAAVAKTSTAAAGGFLRRLWSRIRPTAEDRARKLALAVAVAKALEGHTELEAINLSMALVREPFAKPLHLEAEALSDYSLRHTTCNSTCASGVMRVLRPPGRQALGIRRLD